MGSRAPGVVLAAIQTGSLSAQLCQQAVADPRAGAVVVFTGAVRNHAGGTAVTGLHYEAHPLAAETLRRLAEDTAGRPGVRAVATVHRVGSLEVGELTVVVAVSAEHRGEAFAAAGELIDRIKSEVEIWKRESYGNGASLWVNAPC